MERLVSEPTTYGFGRRGGAILLGLDAPALVLAACLLVLIGLALLLAGIVGLVLMVVVSAAILYAPMPSGQPARTLVFRLGVWAWGAFASKQPDQRVRSDLVSDPQSVLPDGVTIDGDGCVPPIISPADEIHYRSGITGSNNYRCATEISGENCQQTSLRVR